MAGRRNLVVLVVLLVVLAAVLVARFVPLVPAPHPKLLYFSERAQREAFGRAVRQILDTRHFDEVEAMSETLRAGGFAYPSGVAQLHAFYVDGFSAVDDPGDPEEWERHLGRLREWSDARPQSVVARVALAQGLIGRVWAARGHGWAKGVKAGQWRRFEDDVEAAGQVLGQCPPEASANSEWWEGMLQVLHAQGAGSDSLYRATSRAACAAYPRDWHLYGEMAIHLMPRWYGGPGDWQRFADSTARALPQPFGDEVYARILVSQSRFLNNVFRDGGEVSWARVRSGLEAWHRDFPTSSAPRAALAMLAWQAGERSPARQAFAALGDTVDIDVWQSPARFERARAWAAGNDALAALP